MRHPTRAWPTAVAALVALIVLGACVPDAEPDANANLRYTAAERAFVAEVARIHDVQTVDVDGALAGGRNACYLIAQFGLDPITLAGWEEHWHQPWERQWLEAAVTYLCPSA